MGTLAGLPSLSQKLDKETKGLITSLENVKGSGFAKIVTVTNGEDFLLKFKRKSKRIPQNSLEVLRPELVGLKKITLHVVNVGHGYETMIKNQLKKLGLDPESFEPTSCKYSHRFSENGLVRQNNTNEMSFYLRYFVGVAVNDDGKIKTYYEEVFINEAGNIVDVDKATKDDWFNAKGHSQKQAEVGIEKEVKPRNVKLDNLYYFQRGTICENRLTEELKEILDLEEVE